MLSISFDSKDLISSLISSMIQFGDSPLNSFCFHEDSGISMSLVFSSIRKLVESWVEYQLLCGEMGWGVTHVDAVPIC